MVQRKEALNIIANCSSWMFLPVKFLNLAPLKLLAFDVGTYSND